MNEIGILSRARAVTFALAASAVVFSVACGSSSANGSVVAAGQSVGTPCVLPQESQATFTGSSESDVSVGSGARTGGPICLANHFRGRTTCPDGQDDTGSAPAGAQPCTTDSGAHVVGTRVAGQGSAKVAPQCVDRRASDTVIWSCRCANQEGKTDDGDTYCACPSAMTCSPLLEGLAMDPDHMAGSYCIKNGTEYARATACAASCDPATQPCASP